jgi:competence protein ComFC
MSLASLKARPAFLTYHLLWTLVDWLYPPFCGGCETPGSRWCQNCQSQTHLLIDNLCPRCGDYQEKSEICPSCLTDPPPFDGLRSWASYQGALRKAILRLKFHRDIALAESLAEGLIQFFPTLDWQVDMVIAVPVSKTRYKERGYNQAAMLAYPLALACHIPYASQAIHKVLDSPTQVGLSAQERLQNVKEAFTARKKSVHGKSILIVDDIRTTGSTLRSCAQALRTAGATRVYALTLARSNFLQEQWERDMNIGNDLPGAPDALYLLQEDQNGSKS